MGCVVLGFEVGCNVGDRVVGAEECWYCFEGTAVGTQLGLAPSTAIQYRRTWKITAESSSCMAMQIGSDF